MAKTFDLMDALNEVGEWLDKAILDAEDALNLCDVVKEDDDKEYILEVLEKVKKKVESVLHNLN